MLKLLILTILLSGCTSQKTRVENIQAQACLEVYCSSTEESIAKKAGITFAEIMLASYGINIDLHQGVCTELYEKRTIDYRYALISAYELCHPEEK